MVLPQVLEPSPRTPEMHEDLQGVFEFELDTPRRRSSLLTLVQKLSGMHTTELSDPRSRKSSLVPVYAANRRRSSHLRRFSVSSAVSGLSIEDYSHHDPDSAVIEEDDEKVTMERFVPIKVLGRGAYGKVILVRDAANQKLFACKQLKKASLMVGATATRTMAEKNILASILHPNIVKLFYALQDQDKLYLILEYIPGGELFMHLQNKQLLAEDVASYYAAEMALALYHLHRVGVVYRDLKPENCLLDARGHLVLTDFGLSKTSVDDENSCKSIIGTPEYMAPEVLRGEEYSFPVDWWSLGTVIFDMMSGKPPFTGNSHKAISDKILKNKIKYPFYFSQDAQDMLNKLLNKNPSKRFKVDEDFEKFKQHRFFRKIQWKQLIGQDPAVEPPIVPIITDPILAENFDPQFTDMKLSSKGMDIAVPEEVGEDLFNGFSFTASGSFMERYL
ncbi:hypothetical protein BABINDRAFT_163830 [Babjeviella inositovora NRRL Y-12698]|uniref:Protein kinase domain-containing protein n=1 Tax=Babjeviella inositovora NRRL Y-12698 TaxID=984486 RepID=A0A1E3QHC8_9ASCO|nr:uncharacterized protein BABINDRAFT_163830 [Babjeviella inositovora NRRL Y-12698]ODQ77099.1 hypothetical protein BABINDRAFT_163830 [Babjeviella inositovora NRRL Y-12698]